MKTKFSVCFETAKKAGNNSICFNPGITLQLLLLLLLLLTITGKVNSDNKLIALMGVVVSLLKEWEDL
jgi:hypothetical protein